LSPTDELGEGFFFLFLDKVVFTLPLGVIPGDMAAQKGARNGNLVGEEFLALVEGQCPLNVSSFVPLWDDGGSQSSCINGMGVLKGFQMYKVGIKLLLFLSALIFGLFQIHRINVCQDSYHSSSITTVIGRLRTLDFVSILSSISIQTI
jgi:hypothetical protein